MAQSNNVLERDTVSFNPLVLKRQSVLIIVGIALLFWISAFVLWMQVDLDEWLLISHNAIRVNELVISIAQGVSKYGMPSIVLLNLLYYLYSSKDKKISEVSRIMLLVIFMFAIAGIGGDILKEIINRPRPFITYAGELIAFSTAGTPAFPSGHATKSAAMALPFIIMVPARDGLRKGLKVLLAVIALAVCYSRVMLGAHYVSDVLAGIGIALICFPLVTLAANKIMGRMKGKNLELISNIWAAILLALLIYLVV